MSERTDNERRHHSVDWAAAGRYAMVLLIGTAGGAGGIAGLSSGLKEMRSDVKALEKAVIMNTADRWTASAHHAYAAQIERRLATLESLHGTKRR